MRIATWKISSVRLRINHVLRFIKEYDVDVMSPGDIKNYEIIFFFCDLFFYIFMFFFWRNRLFWRNASKKRLILPTQSRKPFSGKNICKYQNGQIKSEGKIKYGLEHGDWSEYYFNGQKETGEYKEGIYTGEWTYWHKNGENAERVNMYKVLNREFGFLGAIMAIKFLNKITIKASVMHLEPLGMKMVK